MEAAERAAAATTRAQQLAMALAREKAEAEKALVDARARVEGAVKAQAAAEEAGMRARTELGKARSRVSKLEVGRPTVRCLPVSAHKFMKRC